MPSKIDKERERVWEATRRRIATQRALFARLPACDALTALKIAMLERAWWLLDGGGESGAEAADALLEFLPSENATTLMDQFFDTKNEFDPTLYGAPIGHGQDAQLQDEASSTNTEASAGQRAEREARPQADRRSDGQDTHSTPQDDAMNAARDAGLREVGT